MVIPRATQLMGLNFILPIKQGEGHMTHYAQQITNRLIPKLWNNAGEPLGP